MILSGGSYGGIETTWEISGQVEDGREYMIIEDAIHVKISDDMAIYYGK